MTTTPGSQYRDYYDRRLAQSLRRYTAKRNSPSSILSRQFLDDPSPLLSTRLLHLAHHYQQQVQEVQPPLSTSCTRDALITAIFARAPITLRQEFQILLEELLEQCQQQHQQSDPSQDELYRAISTVGWVSSSQHLHFEFTSAIHTITQKVLSSLLMGDYETEGLLDQCHSWNHSVLIPFVSKLIPPDVFVQDRWEEKLQYTIYEQFIHIRSLELFELVTEYPDSRVGVRELSAALDGAGRVWYTFLATQWKHVMEQRLLHPGAQTSQIIDVYISTIQVLRIMEGSSGELLHVVTKPIREYLRDREDTIRCIVTSLTEEETGGELYAELRNNVDAAKPLEEGELDDDEEMPTFDWVPPPSILKRRGVLSGRVGTVGSSSRRVGDLLSMLVGIYGSKELFVNEYRIMLADKLLSNLDYETDKEVHNLELLKLRFGEASMRQCEVMIKDIDDSKRIHSNICSTLNNNHHHHPSTNMTDDPQVVDAAIVSHIFWPTLQREEIKNHDRIQTQLDKFSNEYAKLKNPRRLVWMKQLGHVELEIEVYEADEDGHITSHVKEVMCTPAHATLLAHFEDKTQWTVEELATETEMSDDMVRKRMGFWINQRVIQESRYGYSLISAHDANAAEQSFVDHDDDHRENAVSFGADQKEEMQVYESYIVGMLSNLGQIPLEKIHTMLKTFVAGSDHKYEKTPQQLAVFLQQLCKEEKLECSPDGLYKLLKKRS